MDNEKLDKLTNHDFGIPGPTSEYMPSSSHDQKIKVQFLIASRWTVEEHYSEFWLPPSTTLAEACTIANRQLGYILSTSDEYSKRKSTRGKKSIACNVIFIRPTVLAGDVNQTIGEVVTDQFLCFSNSVNCFKVKDMAEGFFYIQAAGVILCFIFIILIFVNVLNKYFWQE